MVGRIGQIIGSLIGLRIMLVLYGLLVVVGTVLAVSYAKRVRRSIYGFKTGPRLGQTRTYVREGALVGFVLGIVVQDVLALSPIVPLPIVGAVLGALIGLQGDKAHRRG